MKIAVIGAGGFVGSQVCKILGEMPEISSISMLDRVAPQGLETTKATFFEGDFSESSLRRAALQGADAVICLAAILGGAAEQDYALARRVNVDATLDLIEDLRDSAPGTRFVFASTIAAYAKPLPDPVTDATPLAPTMIYGAQKVMMEVALSNFAARGWLDAVSLRPAGVMARDGADAALKSAFMSRLFWCVKRGEDISLPVAEDSKTWLASVDVVARNFVHGALVPDLGDNRAFTLPALSLSYGDLVAALRRAYPDSASNISFDPDPETVALFGSYPEIESETADQLGFLRDADADALVANAMV
jgi:nucleoside-diphosphate-sugar epimerase